MISPLLQTLFLNLLVFLTGSIIAKENTRNLTEAQCLQLALKNHPDIIQAERTLLSAQYRYRNQQLQWQPSIKTINQETLIAEEKLTFNTTTGLQWQWPSGGDINLQTSLFYDYDNAKSDLFKFDDNKTYEFHTTITGKQALLGADTQTGLLSEESNKLAYQNATLQYKTTMQKTLASVAQDYRQVLMVQQQVNITQKQVTQAKKSLESLKKEVDAGKKPRNLIPEAEVQLVQFQLDIIQAKNNLRKAKLKLHTNLNIPKDQSLTFTDPTPKNIESPTPVQTQLLRALQKNPSLINLKSQIQLQEKSNLQEQSRQSLQASAHAQVALGKDPRAQGGVHLSYPLDQRSLQLQSATNRTILALQKSQFLQQCNDTIEKLEDLYQDLVYEKKSLELQKKKYSLEQKNYQNLILQHEMGMIAAIILNDKLSALNQSAINLTNKALNYQNKLDNYHIECSTYLEKKQHDLPTNILTNLAQIQTSLPFHKTSQENTETLCQTLLNQ